MGEFRDFDGALQIGQTLAESRAAVETYPAPLGTATSPSSKRRQLQVGQLRTSWS